MERKFGKSKNISPNGRKRYGCWFDEAAVEKIREHAKRHNLKYQEVMRDAVTHYANTVLPTL